MTQRPDPDPVLVEVLEEAQRLGMLGDRPVPEVIEHARRFVAALGARAAGGRLADLGSGGGVPALVIAIDRPDLHIVMIDRRQRRTDFLRRAVGRLGLADRVSVISEEIEGVIAKDPGGFDLVTARGAGPPLVTLAWASALVKPTGMIVISDPPSGRADRWPEVAVADLGLCRSERPGVSVFEIVDSVSRETAG